MKKKWNSLIILLILILLFVFYVYNLYSFSGSVFGEIQQTQQSLSNEPFSQSNIFVANDSGLIASANINNFYIRPGTIIMFFGSTIPSGWVECNGSNGTPDLRDRFPLAYNDSQNSRAQPIGKPDSSKDGKQKVALTVAEMPSHSHTFKQRGTSECKNGAFSSTSGCWLGGPPTDESSITSVTGNYNEHENMPPFYVLKFIMKL